MYNEPIKPESGRQGFLFEQNILMNIEFALNGLEHVFHGDLQNNDCGIYKSCYQYYFFYMESVLNACSGIYNVLVCCNFRNRVAVNRAAILRDYYRIRTCEYPNVFNKNIRNTNEHFDERIDIVQGEMGDFNIITTDMPNVIRDKILDERHLRTIDFQRNVYITYILSDRKLRKVEMDLQSLSTELKRLKSVILSKSVNQYGENLEESLRKNTMNAFDRR